MGGAASSKKQQAFVGPLAKCFPSTAVKDEAGLSIPSPNLLGRAPCGSPSRVMQKPEDASTSAQTHEVFPRPSGSPTSRVGDACRRVRPIMKKFEMHMGNGDIRGEGTSSICRRGTNLETGEEVAVKVYKEKISGNAKASDVTLQKFKRQIAVLLELQKPFVRHADPSLWHEELANVKPAKIFMKLLDYSQDKDGNPGYDVGDGVLYVVTELAQYSLKDFLTKRREKAKPLSEVTVRNMCRSIVTAMAGLHAKGFVHLDMKPENLMVFNGRLKVIDVDGCVRRGTKVNIKDSSISFSPCYCAPEWAIFLVSENNDDIRADARLDSWSVGMTLCELVTLTAVLKPQYAKFVRNVRRSKEAGFFFMEWLSTISAAPIPSSVQEFDAGLMDFISNWLLVCQKGQRKTCAQCLSSPYISQVSSGEGRVSSDDADVKWILRERPLRPVDDSNGSPLFKGTLWKLNADGDNKRTVDFIKRDIWIAQNHSLCYFSVKESKRLVLIDGQHLEATTICPVENAAMEHCFEIKLHSDDAKFSSATFACESQHELNEWVDKLSKVSRMDMLVTMKLGDKMAEDLKKFRMMVKNRRLKIDARDKDSFVPRFQKKLWKVKAEGDREKQEDWFLRDMWLAKNGSLVYWSPKEGRELVYYTAEDLSHATVNRISAGASFRDWAFSVQLPSVDGVEFAPGEFAAETSEEREQWLDELAAMVAVVGGR